MSKSPESGAENKYKVHKYQLSGGDARMPHSREDKDWETWEKADEEAKIAGQEAENQLGSISSEYRSKDSFYYEEIFATIMEKKGWQIKEKSVRPSTRGSGRLAEVYMENEKFPGMVAYAKESPTGQIGLTFLAGAYSLAARQKQAEENGWEILEN